MGIKPKQTEVEKLTDQLKRTKAALRKKTAEFNALRNAGNNFVNYVTGINLPAKPVVLNLSEKKTKQALKARSKPKTKKS